MITQHNTTHLDPPDGLSQPVHNRGDPSHGQLGLGDVFVGELPLQDVGEQGIRDEVWGWWGGCGCGCGFLGASRHDGLRLGAVWSGDGDSGVGELLEYSATCYLLHR